jgi:hypothetical protein
VSAYARALLIILWLLMAAAARADPPINLRVVIEPTTVGAVARFTFDRPVSSFEMSYEADEIRHRTWNIVTPGVRREGSVVTASNGKPFDAFAVEIVALSEPTDATYPNVFRVGAEGIAFYAGYFVGTEPAFQTTIEVAPAPGRTVEGFPTGGNLWRVDTTFHRNAGHRYVYVGPPSFVSETRYARFVMPPGLPTALVARIRENVDAATAYYTRKLARPLPSKPLIIVAPNFDHKHPGAQGDTTTGPSVALRLFGERWKTLDPKSDRLDHLIAHEAAHFWTSDTYHAAKGSPAWMWEGGAELQALEARSAAMKRLTRSARREHIEGALNKCLPSLFDQPITVPRSGVTYVCGETIFWIADAAEKKRSRGHGDIFAIWRRMYDRADSAGGIYTLGDFLTSAATSDNDARALQLFLTDSGGERWQTLPEVLKPLGIELAKDPAPHDANTHRHIALWHVLTMTCTGNRGMRRMEDYIEFDTGKLCGPLSGNPVVDSLNGHNLFTDMSAAYAAAQTACATGGDLVFTRTGKPEKWVVPCTKPLAPVPPKFRIVSTP